jgi:hypothetical protein
MEEETKKEPDYKKLYLEQRLIALQMESQALLLRFGQVQQELSTTQKELDAYLKKDEQKIQTK